MTKLPNPTAIILTDDVGHELTLGVADDGTLDLSIGVWAILDHDYGETITAVYPTELEALRVLNARGYGRVQAVAWGHDANGNAVQVRA